MTYEVVWTDPAVAQLLKILEGVTDEAGVARAAERLDAVLGSCPDRTGESREPGIRSAFGRPLGIKYTVVEDDERVYVLRVWWTGR